MKAYSTYKDSGVEWIGEIPEHWDIIKLKYICNIFGRIGFRGYTTNDLVEKGEGAISISPSNIKNNEFNLNKCTYLSWDKYHESPEIKIYPKDVILVKTGSTIGKVAYIPEDTPEMTLNPQLIALKDINHVSKYLYYQITCGFFQTQLTIDIVGGSTPTISQEKVYSFQVLDLPRKEQNNIANFLDHKTAQIDLSIEKRRELIELLKEHRSAIINEAVTKGINPDAPMKDSGIEWIEEIPEHWDVTKMKFLGHIKYGLGQPPRKKEGGLPIIRATNVERGNISEKNMVYVDPEDIPYERDPVLRENDIIVVRSGAYTADSAIIPSKYDGAITGYDMVFRPQAINPQFIAYGLLSNYILHNQLYLHRLRAAQPHLNAEELGETSVLLPSTQEQKEIVEYIKTETARIDEEIKSTQQEIDLLKEYRQSLIAEAVTGKIDVRDYVLED